MPPHRSASRVRRLRTVLASALILSFAAPFASAHQNDNTVKGAATNHIFSSSFGDSVDTLSGQLTFQVPIGPSFSVSESLKYQLFLTYTSKVWRYDGNFFAHPEHARDRIEGRAQAGVGFHLQMGRIYWKWAYPSCSSSPKSLILQFGDGTEHEILNSRTTDSSYLRIDSSSLGYQVTTPDGTLYTFDHWVDDPNFDPLCVTDDSKPHNPWNSEIGGYYLTKIQDIDVNGAPLNSVTITYETAQGMTHLINGITDSRGRSIVVNNATCDLNAGLTDAQCDPNMPRPGYVTSVRLPAFNVPATDPNAAIYSFHYDFTTTHDDLVRLDPNDAHPLPNEVFLTKLQMPDVVHDDGTHERYQMSFDYKDHEDPNHPHVGLVTSRILPSGAEVQYGYARYTHAVSGPSGAVSSPSSCMGVGIAPLKGLSEEGSPCRGELSGSAPLATDMPATNGVIWKKVRSNPDTASPFAPGDPNRREDTWTWNRNFTLDPQHFQALSNPYKVIETDPMGNWIVHFFSASIPGDPNLPSSQSHLYDWDDGLPTATEWYLSLGGTPLKGIYQEYEDDQLTSANKNCDFHADPNLAHSMANRRAKATTLVYYEGGIQAQKTVESDFNCLGNYRLTKELAFGTKPYREHRRGYYCSPDDPNRAFDPNNPCPILPDGNIASWTLNPYTYDDLLDGAGNIVSQSDLYLARLRKV